MSVTDNGTGIEVELLPHVFDLFTQGERALHRTQGGLGVGLAIVKSLVELHGGSVSVTSTLGEGSCFTVALSLQRPPAKPSEADEAKPVRPTKALHIVLVDDNVDAAETLAIRLRADGHVVSVHFDSSSALTWADGNTADVFILDIGLPDLDGYTLARLLREQPTGRGATFIALTGYGQAQDREQSKAAGFHHHLVKPVATEQLTTLLQRHALRSSA